MEKDNIKLLISAFLRLIMIALAVLNIFLSSYSEYYKYFMLLVTVLFPLELKYNERKIYIPQNTNPNDVFDDVVTPQIVIQSGLNEENTIPRNSLNNKIMELKS